MQYFPLGFLQRKKKGVQGFRHTFVKLLNFLNQYINFAIINHLRMSMQHLDRYTRTKTVNSFITRTMMQRFTSWFQILK